MGWRIGRAKLRFATKEFCNRWFMSRKFKLTCYFLLVIGGLFTIGFLYKRIYCDWDLPIDAEVIGQYGDFIGGTIGTFITLILLYVTLTLQRRTFDSQEKVSKKNIEMLAMQQLSDKFFKLYEVYKDTLAKFSVFINDEYLEGKSALRFKYATLFEKFDNSIPSGVLRKAAVMDFVGFYASLNDFAPVYFRTLSLMFEDIERSSDVAIEERLKYVRLMRAQFTSTELVLIRYNAMTAMGTDAIQYINRYNLLKHLPPMELMEYKEWRRHHHMTDLQVNGLNTILLALKSRMIHALTGDKQQDIKSSAERYTFIVTASMTHDVLTVELKRDLSQKLNKNDIQYEAWDGFKADELRDFLGYFVKDCVVIQNFNRYNERRELAFDSKSGIEGNIETVSVAVTNNSHRRIAMNYAQYEELMR